MTSPDHPVLSARTRYRTIGLFSRLLLCGLMALLTLAITPACAQPSDTKISSEPAVDIDTVLGGARAKLDEVQKGLKKPQDSATLLQFRAAALAAQTQAEAAATRIAPEMVSVKARLAQLGAPQPGAPEAPDVAAQRKELSKNSGKLDAQNKLAKLLSVEAGQAAEQILTLRRAHFQARLGERTDSVLGQHFWTEMLREWPKDTRRLQPLRAELTMAITGTPVGVWIGVLAAIIILLGLRVRAGRALMRLTSTRVPPGRLRRSLFAVALVLLAAVVPGLIAELVRTGVNWNALLSESTDALLGRLVGIVGYGGFVAGLGHALLAPERPSWRLPPILDTVAAGLRWFPLSLAAIIVIGWSAERLGSLINVSLSATVALDCLMALALNTVIGLALARARRLRRDFNNDPDITDHPPIPLWLAVLPGLAWLTLTVSVVCVLTGYVAFGNFVVKQLVWIATVLSSAYLLTTLIHDGCASLQTTIKRNADDENLTHARTRTQSQALVLFSGLGRLLVVLLALILLLAPFGEGPTELLGHIDYLHAGIAIGEVQIRPAAVLQSVLVLLLSFGAVKVFQRWLEVQYLPTTSLDPGMRISAATLFGYVGYVIAVALALSAAGIGLERVAWIASALSVGIGFGLQAVVQNFVSGLILLAERPVRVGDWVSLGGVEGDIRRINVRATEIQMSDRSTVIVPNSEFITKVVRNVTHANPLGLVQIKLPMPLSTDPEQVRSLVLAAFQDHVEVLDEPMPKVFLDTIDANGLVFNATGYVNSPRAAYTVRSALLFDVLVRLHEANLSLAKPPTMIVASPAQSNPPDLPDTSAAARRAR
jgi:small-conductance mechanosensitive channel